MNSTAFLTSGVTIESGILNQYFFYRNRRTFAFLSEYLYLFLAQYQVSIESIVSGRTVNNDKDNLERILYKNRTP